MALIELLLEEQREARLASGNCHTVASIEIAERKSPSPKLDLVLTYFQQHPENISLSNREIARRLGVSHTWVSKARQILDRP